MSNLRSRRSLSASIQPRTGRPRFGLPTVTSIPPGATEQLWLLAANAPIAALLEIPFCIPVSTPLLTFGLYLARPIWEMCLVELLRDMVRGLGIPEVDVSGAPRPWLDMQGAPGLQIRISVNLNFELLNFKI